MKANRLMLIIAVAAGVLATILAFQYISSATRSIQDRQTENQVAVLFTVNDLPADHVIDPAVDLRQEFVGEVTSAALVRSAVKYEELEALRGQRIYSPVPAGMPLMYSHLTPLRELKIGADMRAISIQVDETSTFGGMLVPGDRVDVIALFRDTPPPAPSPGAESGDPMAMVESILDNMATGMATSPDDWRAIHILTDIRVLAVGDRLDRSRTQFPYGMGGSFSSGVVTLEVTPAQAMELIEAQGGGQNPIQLLLRPPRPGSGEGDASGTLIEGG